MYTSLTLSQSLTLEAPERFPRTFASCKQSADFPRTGLRYFSMLPTNDNPVVVYNRVSRAPPSLLFAKPNTSRRHYSVVIFTRQAHMFFSALSPRSPTTATTIRCSSLDRPCTYRLKSCVVTRDRHARSTTRSSVGECCARLPELSRGIIQVISPRTAGLNEQIYILFLLFYVLPGNIGSISIRSNTPPCLGVFIRPVAPVPLISVHLLK